MPEGSEVYHPSENLSLKKLKDLKGQRRKIKTEKGIETAEELLQEFRRVVERILYNSGVDEDEEIQNLPQCLRMAAINTVSTIRNNWKEIMRHKKSVGDQSLEEWVERVQKEGIGGW